MERHLGLPDHSGLILALGSPYPTSRIVRDELAEVGRASGKHYATQVSNPRLHPVISEAHIDLLVKLVDDLGRRGVCAQTPNQ